MMTISEREHIRSQKEKQKKRNTLTTIIILGLVLVIAAVIILTQVMRPKLTLANEKGMSLGNPEAPVKVIEFSNYSCGHCRAFAIDDSPDFIKNYVDTGKVYYTSYPYPWSETDLTYKASMAAYCTAEQDVYFAYKNEVFKSVFSANDLADGKERVYAKRAGADMDEFDACMNKQEIPGFISATKNLAEGYNVTGTPSFIVNGKLVYRDSLNSTVEAALSSGN